MLYAPYHLAFARIGVRRTAQIGNSAPATCCAMKSRGRVCNGLVLVGAAFGQRFSFCSCDHVSGFRVDSNDLRQDRPLRRPMEGELSGNHVSYRACPRNLHVDYGCESQAERTRGQHACSLFAWLE